MTRARRVRALATRLRGRALSVWYVLRDPRTPWWVRAIAALVIAYALSPIDLIPDFIPVLGYLDDAVIVPFGLALVLRFTPPHVRLAAEARAADVSTTAIDRWVRWGYVAAAVILGVWVIVLVLLLRWAVVAASA